MKNVWFRTSTAQIIDQGDQLFESVKKLIRSGITNGSVFLVISLTTGTIALILYLLAWILKSEADRMTREASIQILSLEHEPRTNNNNPGIISAILSPIQNQLENQATNSIPNDVDSVIENYLSNMNNIDINEFKADSTVLRKLCSFMRLHSCIIDKNSTIRYLDNGLIFSTPLSRTLVPPSEVLCGSKVIDSIVAIFNSDPGMRCEMLSQLLGMSNNDSSYWGDVLTPATQKQLALLLSLHSISVSMPKRTPQVYVISPLGLFYHRVGVDESLLAVSSKRPMYKYEASPYLQMFIEPEGVRYIKKPYNDRVYEVYVSTPYLDIAGLGLVKTYSMPIKDIANNTISVFCVDYTMDVGELYAAMKIRPVNDSNRVATWTNNIYDYYFWTKKRGENAYFLRKYDMQNFKVFGSYKQTIDLVRFDFSDAMKVVKGEDEEGNEMFVVPLNIENDIQRMALITPSKHRYYEYPLIMAIIMTFVSLLSLAVGNYEAGVAGERSRLANILRNIPTGIIELVTDHGVVAVRYANDHAEEIFGVSLPRFGEVTAKKMGNFMEMFDDGIIIRDKNTPTKYETKSYEYINKMKERGKIYKYYARIRRPVDGSGNYGVPKKEVWLEISGTPILDKASEISKSFIAFRKIEDDVLEFRLNATMNCK